MADGRTMAVAKGGIATDATDRTKLNPETMVPNLSQVSLAGGVEETVPLDATLRRNSIRHLALGKGGLDAFAMQWEGEDGLAPPLLGLHRCGTAPVLAAAPEADELLMQGYAGSVAVSVEGLDVAITAPRGGRLHRFLADGTFIGVSRGSMCAG